MSRKVEIFRAGKQTDSAGNERDWTVADLDTMAAKYDPSFHEAPVCIGHPKDNAPAWAWVKKVTREGSTLFAEIGDEVEEFSEMLKKKMFKKRSISLYPDLSIRHLAFLGAQPPAVKGLKDFEFAEKGEPFTLDYSEETAMDTKELEAALATEKTAREAAEAKVAEFGEKLGQEQSKTAALTARVTVMEAAAQEKDFSDFCDKQVRAGKLLPAQKDSAITIMKSLAGQAALDFAEGDKTIKKTPLEVYKASLEAAPKVLDFEEHATKGKAKTADPDDKLTALTKAKMAENKGMSFNEASRLVLKENPDLNFSADAT